MNGADIVRSAPKFRGRLTVDAALAPYTWFRVGGAADVLASPADADDLAYLLQCLPAQTPVTVLGVGSNVIVRDAGVRGVVIRLGGRAFGAVDVLEEGCVRAGAAALDAQVARRCADAGLDGLSFLRGIPGTIGGALRMNAGAHGGEIEDCLIEAVAYDRAGVQRRLDAAAMGFSYRHSRAPDDLIFVGCTLKGRPGERDAILADMERITAAREASQPIREKTGGSTFKNPPEGKAWQLIDAAGCRGLVQGDAQVSEMHCNFLINRGAATAQDIEALGDEVRRRVRENSGVTLEWEIKRIGEARAEAQGEAR